MENSREKRWGSVGKEGWRARMDEECVPTLWEMLKLGKRAEPTARQGAEWSRYTLEADTLGQSREGVEETLLPLSFSVP